MIIWCRVSSRSEDDIGNILKDLQCRDSFKGLIGLGFGGSGFRGLGFILFRGFGLLVQG